MARYFLLTLTFVLVGTFALAQTSIAGKVTDAEDGSELIGANLKLLKNGVFVSGASTDFDGNYSINLDPGVYDVEVSYVGIPTNKITGVVVKAGQANALDVVLGGGDEAGGITLTDVIVVAYKVPLIEQDNTTQGGIVTSKEIRNLPTKDISALAATTAGLSQADEGGDVSIRGSRADATNYYIDGIRVSGSLIPESEIEQLQVITGGIQAQYGDVTGGIISITSKGPSGKFSGGLELETSEYLDNFGYNLVSLNLSGPILKNKTTGKSILGFRLSGRYRTRLDDDPSAVPLYKIKDEKLKEIEANPVTEIGSSQISSAEFLTDEDVDEFGFRQDEQRKRLDLTAKLDARLSDAIDISLSGSFLDEENRFTPLGVGILSDANRLMNSHNNPTDFTDSYRANFRFRHRLGKGASYDEADADKKASLIQNAQYTLTFGYEHEEGKRNDPRHGENPFNYGYVGKFETDLVPSISFPNTNEYGTFLGSFDDQDFYVQHNDNSEVFTGYTAGDVNPVLANYNNVADVDDRESFIQQNGFQVGTSNVAWGLHYNPGRVYNLIHKDELDLYTFNILSSFDLLPGGSDKGRHNVQFGVVYEQRVDRLYDLNPRTLWTIARQQANRHILGVDTSQVVGSIITDVETPIGLVPDVEIPLYETLLDLEGQSGLSFYEKVRGVAFPGMSLDESLHEYVFVDELTPDQLSLDMFSPDEITSQSILYYSGYDYLGNKISTDVTFDDFFSEKKDGVRTFPVAASQPNYFAAYIQDKFTFKDIIFRLGLRLDRFDANTKVLKDAFSLYDIVNAKDFYDQTGLERPAAVEDDYKVYVEGEGSNVVKAFRKDEQWYFANGSAANSGALIYGGQVVNAKLTNPSASIKDDDYDSSNSFEDYEPQLNWMPRLAFSFPISDAANFFAHYDILVQRPPSNNYVSPLRYYYFVEEQPENNPNLRPERTIDYEVGFQQKLTNSSSLKIAVYYKELRDMIQRRQYSNVPLVVSYESFGNIDFGTVKGFTFQYDLRRTGNVSLKANYTLQFADGTGSDADEREDNTSVGVIRNLFPLSFDERHRIVGSLDYRYSSGKQYNGPRLFGKDIFANGGLNLQAIAVSGRPYTVNKIPDLFDGTGIVGQINGARTPWNFTVNLRVDKDFVLSKSEKFPLNLNIYLRVQNLLNRKNTIEVYSATGSPSDDGYLASANGLDRLQNIEEGGQNVEAYISSYHWRLLDPDNFSLPRRIFLGALFEF